MTGRDFIKHYGSRDEDEMVRVEGFHTDLLNTLDHFIADEKIKYARLHLTFHPNHLNLANFMAWLREQTES